MRIANVVKTGLVAGAAVLALAGCGSSAKDDIVDAYSELNKADTYEMTTNVSFDVEGDSFTAEEAEIFNSLSLDMHTLSDVKNDQHEMTIGLGANFGPMNLAMDMPLFLDGDDVYMKVDGYMNLMSNMTSMLGFPMMMETPAELEGKIVKMEDDVEGEPSEQQQIALDELSKEIEALLKDVSEDSFEKDGNTITYTVNGQEVLHKVIDVLEENPSLFEAEGVEGMDVGEMMTEMREALDESITVGDVVVVTTLDGGTLAKEDVTLPISITNEFDETIALTLHVNNTYENIGGKLDFTFDLSEDNIITTEELEEALGESFQGSFEFEIE